MWKRRYRRNGLPLPEPVQSKTENFRLSPCTRNGPALSIEALGNPHILWARQRTVLWDFRACAYFSLVSFVLSFFPFLLYASIFTRLSFRCTSRANFLVGQPVHSVLYPVRSSAWIARRVSPNNVSQFVCKQRMSTKAEARVTHVAIR